MPGHTGKAEEKDKCRTNHANVVRNVRTVKTVRFLGDMNFGYLSMPDFTNLLSIIEHVIFIHIQLLYTDTFTWKIYHSMTPANLWSV